MRVFNAVDATPIKAWLPEAHEVEAQAMEQVARVSRLPFVKHLALMPDVHVGLGATIGSVIATERAIIPAAVGVDIGCGMMAQKLSLTASDLPDNLFNIRSDIEEAVPHGRTKNGGPGDAGSFGASPESHWNAWRGLRGGLTGIQAFHPKVQHDRAMNQLGTLGTGNHFIELCLDEDQNVWIMLHSGSRGVGNLIGRYFIEKAKEDMKIHHINLEDKDLSYLSEGTRWFEDYVDAVDWAQNYARVNRELMMVATIGALTRLSLRGRIPHFQISHGEGQAINCHHNYVTKENHRGRNLHITRKGAVQAREGTLGIIPGSMGAKSFIVRGKGNPDSLNSCSHGAGRVMSRTEARKRFTSVDLVNQTQGVECRKDVDVVDEIPGAYKDIDSVMEAQEDLVDIIHTLRQVVCVKG